MIKTKKQVNNILKVLKAKMYEALVNSGDINLKCSDAEVIRTPLQNGWEDCKFTGKMTISISIDPKRKTS